MTPDHVEVVAALALISVAYGIVSHRIASPPTARAVPGLLFGLAARLAIRIRWSSRPGLSWICAACR